jgi:hypothetical protein
LTAGGNAGCYHSRSNVVSTGEERTMIARTWRGWTTPQNADAYQNMLLTKILPGIRQRHPETAFKGTYLLRRTIPEGEEFVTLMIFESMEAVRNFAGPNYDLAVIAPDAAALLTRFDERSQHYEILLTPDPI